MKKGYVLLFFSVLALLNGCNSPKPELLNTVHKVAIVSVSADADIRNIDRGQSGVSVNGWNIYSLSDGYPVFAAHLMKSFIDNFKALGVEVMDTNELFSSPAYAQYLNTYGKYHCGTEGKPGSWSVDNPQFSRYESQQIGNSPNNAQNNAHGGHGGHSGISIHVAASDAPPRYVNVNPAPGTYYVPLGYEARNMNEAMKALAAGLGVDAIVVVHANMAYKTPPFSALQAETSGSANAAVTVFMINALGEYYIREGEPYGATHYASTAPLKLLHGVPDFTQPDSVEAMNQALDGAVSVWFDRYKTYLQ